jgi:NAD+ synthase (glutamine-hydrolysing)
MTTSPLRIALGQVNPIVGAVESNRAQLLAETARAREAGAGLVVFPEMATLGYPPKDLLDLPGIVEGNLETVAQLKAVSHGIAVLVGYVDRDGGVVGKPLTNSAVLLVDGERVARWDKALLPTYDVFDEARYFEPATKTHVVDFDGHKLGVTLCEDIWLDPVGDGRPLYHRSPAQEQIALGADLLINLSASPFEMGKLSQRRALARDLALSSRAPVVYCNQVGGNDELVFDGGSFIVNASGCVVAQAARFATDLLIHDIGGQDIGAQQDTPPPSVHEEDEVAAMLAALELGLADYVRKCGFSRVVLGLSGGIDSAVTCAIAARALGPDRVTGLLMPSPYSSDHSVEDALDLARRLGVATHTLPIQGPMKAFEDTLSGVFAEREPDVTEENIQARVRGTLLMSWSNKFGDLLLTTGNKSELAVGYCTLYGDMAGGLSLLSDVPKMWVYALANHINTLDEVIPASTIEKPPSAELRPDQLDSDSLPPYEILDALIAGYVEEGLDAEALVGRGFERESVERVIHLIHLNEYKRRQAAPGIKISSRAFGFGRRFPIAHRRS